MTPARVARARARRRRLCLDAVRPRPCGRRFADRHRRPARAGRVRAGDDPAATDRGRPRPELCATRPDRRTSARRQLRCGPAPRRAGSASRCSTASPARARPRSISKRSPRRVEAGKQVLILLPEIALTQAFLERFHDRFGARPAEWHSDVPPRMRERVWRQVAEGRVARRRRRAFGAVPAVQGTRPDHRRRGARPRLQAGRPRLLPCARHGGGARPHRRLPGRARLGDAVGRKPRQRASRAATPASRCRRGLPMPRCPTSAPSTCAARRRPAAASCRRSCLRHISGQSRTRRAVAALPQPPRLCAADALPRLRPSLPMPGLLELAGRASLPRAARLPPLRPSAKSGRRPARNAARSTIWSPAARASSASPRRCVGHFPDARTIVLSSDILGGVQTAAARARGDRQGRSRHRHRHAACRQGAQFSRT